MDYPKVYQEYAGEEMTKHYDANLINIEYRFFGKSIPEGLSIDSEKYWEYMNSENASKDFHHIITQLKTLFKGSTIFTGYSKGGYTTENMACYFPDDIDAYVSYMAPFCNSINDPRFYQNIYCTIGDLTYGKEKSKHYRDIMIEFQKLVLSEEYRTIIQKELFEKVDRKEIRISSLISKDEAYEVLVLDIASSTWQYYQDFDKFEKCLNMPDTNQNQLVKKIEVAKEILLTSDSIDELNLDSTGAPYGIQSYTEMGNYLYDLKYLREAGANIKTPQEKDESLGIRISAPMLLDSKLKLFSNNNDNLLNYFKTTEKDIIKIYGKSDTWYAVRMPETNNPHIHIFEVNNSHISNIDMLPEKEKKECYDLIDGLLKK